MTFSKMTSGVVSASIALAGVLLFSAPALALQNCTASYSGLTCYGAGEYVCRTSPYSCVVPTTCTGDGVYDCTTCGCMCYGACNNATGCYTQTGSNNTNIVGLYANGSCNSFTCPGTHTYCPGTGSGPGSNDKCKLTGTNPCGQGETWDVCAGTCSTPNVLRNPSGAQTINGAVTVNGDMTIGDAGSDFLNVSGMSWFGQTFPVLNLASNNLIFGSASSLSHPQSKLLLLNNSYDSVFSVGLDGRTAIGTSPSDTFLNVQAPDGVTSAASFQGLGFTSGLTANSVTGTGIYGTGGLYGVAAVGQVGVNAQGSLYGIFGTGAGAGVYGAAGGPSAYGGHFSGTTGSGALYVDGDAVFSANTPLVFEGSPILSTGTIYYDTATNKFKVSENGGAYVDLVGGGAGGAVSSVTGGGAGINVTPTTGAVIVTNTGDTDATNDVTTAGGTFSANAFTFGNASNSFTGTHSGNGSALTSLSASNLSSGTVPTARLGSGTANSTTFLRGDSTWASGPVGPQGPQGVQGPAGPAGPQGPAGPSGGWTDAGTNLVLTTGTDTVGIGNTGLAGYKLDVTGNGRFTTTLGVGTTPPATGISVYTFTALGTALLSNSLSGTSGIFTTGTTSAGYYGVNVSGGHTAVNAITTGNTGVYGQGSIYGVRGITAAAAGTTGVYGAAGDYGVQGSGATGGYFWTTGGTSSNYALRANAANPTWAIYTTGTGYSYFNERVGLGDTTPTERLSLFDNNGIAIGDVRVLFKSTGTTGDIRIGTGSGFTGKIAFDTSGLEGMRVTGSSYAMAPTRIGFNSSFIPNNATGTYFCLLAPGDGFYYLTFCSSIRSLKNEIKDSSLGLATVNKLRPVTFKWKSNDEEDIGLIAEEVEAVNPILATYKENTLAGVKYPQMSAVLIKAVQELDLKFEGLEASVDGQDDRLRKLEDRVRALETELKSLKD